MKELRLCILEKIVEPYPTWELTGMNLMHIYAKLMLENLLFFRSREKADRYLYVFRTFKWRP